jgi:hypothetical protein
MTMQQRGKRLLVAVACEAPQQLAVSWHSGRGCAGEAVNVLE